MHYHHKISFLIFNLFFFFLNAQELQSLSYKTISDLYENYPENDSRAMVFVNKYIEKAKKDNNWKKQITGYEDAIYYTEDINRKLSYADSAIVGAFKSGDRDIISRAYLGKGIIYYYNKRQYKYALEQYLKAYQFSRNSSDDYLQNKINYHLGMVKSYLGYYEEAADHFRSTSRYFEESMKGNLHPNIRLNNESGYFNSIYRLSNCYKNLRLYNKEDSLISIGLKKLKNINEHLLEYGYFQKGKGVQLLRKGNTDEALKHLKLSRDILVNNQDYNSLTAVYFYLGKLYWLKGNRAESLVYLNKVDSMINKVQFTTPEIHSSYKYLITDATESGSLGKRLYYSDQFLQTNSTLNVDFAMLTSKIRQEYDTERLLEEKQLLENKLHNDFYFLVATPVIIVLLFFLIIRLRNRENKFPGKFIKIWKKFRKYYYFLIANKKTSEKKKTHSPEIIEDIKEKLKKFEEDKRFLDKNLTLPMVAKMFGRTHSQLSYVLNEHLNISFTQYLKVLRIKYITALLLENDLYLKYNIENLAHECGMSSRQLFSTHFLEINGIRPIDFIKNRMKEIDEN